jgi:hypothetical protein
MVVRKGKTRRTRIGKRAKCTALVRWKSANRLRD